MTISTVGTTGRDYSTSKAWADACAADITATEDWIGEGYNDGTITETAAVALDSTQDATHRMILRCATGHSFKDDADKLTNALRPNQANGVLFNITTHTDAAFVLSPFAKIQGIQITDTRGYGIGVGQGTNTVADMGRMENVLARGTAASGGNPFCNIKRLNLINSALIVTNNAIGLWDEGSVSGRASSNTIINVSGSSSAKGINCSEHVYNNAVFGFGADNTIGASSSNNATDRASFGGGSSNQVSIAYTTLPGDLDLESVTSGSEDLRVLADSTLENNGVRDQTWTSDLDIVGSSRSTSTPSIGAWEYVAGGGGGAVGGNWGAMWGRGRVVL